jgi:predicted ATPase/serine phosphatase RsbU (regulator of sigma subunit)/tRNA A-37 threonylcarbamoyl transferase component Bud32
MLILPHYQMGPKIYESANSIVYRAYRKKQNQSVILKMLKEDYPTQEELTRYQQEYELINLFNLDGIIKAYAIEKYQNRPVLILEDFGGSSLKLLMGSEPFSLNAFFQLALKIADTLAKIHAAHLIHKDINPSNIIFNPETNQLKIIDFGIATRLPRENPKIRTPEQLEGTLAYLSPEQTGRINRSLDYRTDLYSLGVTFYELLTGSPPFSMLEAMELVHCHIAKTPEPVCEVNPKVPPILSDIVMKLMAKSASDRYQSAFAVKSDLQRCQVQFAQTKQIHSFPLAENEFSGKLQISKAIYGRDLNLIILSQAFERVTQGTLEMMLVAGYSGVGKSALVHQVSMNSKKAYFAAGKFDQFQKHRPYSAITQAFNQFCRYLLKESAETLAKWQLKILDAVGNNGQIIIDVIPDLELVIGPQPPVVKVGPTEAQNRFKMFFLNFVRALCHEEHPLILFIDDLQWLDSASLALLKSIMLDNELQYLLIIGAYRDNEVDRSHPFIRGVDELQKANAIINTIELENLLAKDINQLLQDSLKCDAEESQPLTELIYQKTQGNAFFTHQFLQTLYEEGLLHFDFEYLKWCWDVEQIAAQNITANVVDLMAKKIDKLPAKTSSVLQLAACIGHQFELSILAIIYESTENDTFDNLQPAVAEGLIEILEDKSFKHSEKKQFMFLHDRVQQAAYTLIESEQRQAVHLQIGRLLLNSTSGEALEEKVFDIVGQFNPCLTLINNQFERLKIARLNLMAGKKAKMAMAYGAALNYLKCGRECLTENTWETEYDLTLNLFTESAEAAYLNGEFDKMSQLVQEVLQQARGLSDEAKVYEIQIQAYAAQNQQRKAIQIALIFLKRLGISLPEEPTQEEIGLNLHKMQTALSEKSIHSLIDLPLMTDKKSILAMRIMVATSPAAYHVLPGLMILLILKQVELSLEYGNVPESSFAYVSYGFILCAILFELESGYQFGLLSLNLLKRLDNERLKTRIIFVFNDLVSPWKKHIKEALPALLNSYQIGLETGDIEFAAYSMLVYLYFTYFTGKPLLSVEQEMARYNQGMIRLKQEGTLNRYYLYWQVVLNLLGHAKNDPCDLIGEVYDETLQLPRHQEANDRTVIYYLYLHKCILNYLFQNYGRAVENADKAQEYLDGVTGTLEVAIFHFYDSLARLALSPSLEAEAQEAVLSKVSANQQKMKLWAQQAPENFQHKYDLVEAELAQILGDVKAIEWYEKAIAGAAENQYLQEEALAYELAGKFYLSRGMDKIAPTYLKEAHYRYQQWEASAKVDNLQATYPQILSIPKRARANISGQETVLSTNHVHSSTVLDLESVMKAAQTFSGEIVLSQLLEKMMLILIENAGAERGLLILEKEKGLSEWRIEAEGTFKVEKVRVLESLPIENHLPLTIVNYVLRTREAIVLANAMQEGIYTEDNYIQAYEVKSVLCHPILHQGQLIGLLYLENNLTPGVFTAARLKIVEMLSCQAAISLENALLYHTLEQKVEERTAQLATANEEITLLNERLKEENLRMSAELDVAKQLQQMVLPKEKELEGIEQLDIAGFMAAAEEVGGDYYDVLQYQDRLKIGIGDVTGHGLESGVLMLMVQTAVRTLLVSEINDPKVFLNCLNRVIYDNIKRIESDKNLTLSLLDYKNGEVQLVGQHEEVLVVRKNAEIERLNTIDLGFMVGVMPNIAKTVSHDEIHLEQGDGIVLYTDGITEAHNPEMTLYGIERLCEVVSQYWHLSAKAIQQAVIADVRAFIGEQQVYDDITLLVLKQQ